MMERVAHRQPQAGANKSPQDDSEMRYVFPTGTAGCYEIEELEPEELWRLLGENPIIEPAR